MTRCAIFILIFLQACAQSPSRVQVPHTKPYPLGFIGAADALASHDVSEWVQQTRERAR